MVRAVAVVLAAALLASGTIGAGDAAAQGTEPSVVAYLRGARCMLLTDGGSRGAGGPPPVFAGPRADAPRLGIATDPVIVTDPPRLVNGYARVLLSDGSSGWVRRDRLRTWAVTASPGLRCLPARMSDGRLGFDYAHPG